MTDLVVSSGPPPERYANRVISEALSGFAREHAQRWEFIENLVKDPRVHDGCPKSQRRLEAKVRAAGGVRTFLQTGSRGRYRLRVYSWVGWDPSTDKPITDADDIPARAQLAHFCYEVLGEGKGSVRFTGYSVLIVSAHVLSRCVQRWQVKTLHDLRRVIDTIGTVALNYIVDRQAETDDWHVTPPPGAHVPLPGGKSALVLRMHRNPARPGRDYGAVDGLASPKENLRRRSASRSNSACFACNALTVSLLPSGCGTGSGTAVVTSSHVCTCGMPLRS
jgi:hypothetical protein